MKISHRDIGGTGFTLLGSKLLEALATPTWRWISAPLLRAVLFFPAILLCFGFASGGLATAATQNAVAPDATPHIAQVQPSEVKPGSRLTLTIDGERFAEGAYVSFSDPAIRVLSTRRLSDTRLEVDVAVGDKAQPESVRLYVANPAGTAGESSFAIVLSPASPVASSSSGAKAPEISAIDPAHVSPGSKVNIKVTGKRFAKGAKVAFGNPGIRVLGTEFKKSTRLVAQIEVAPDAPTGETSLFVVNPDESEVEAGFEVSAGSSSKSKSNDQTAATGATTPAATQRFSVINLGDAISIFQNPNKPKGELILSGGKLTYQEGGKDVFVAGRGDIREIAPNLLFSINTGTFHIILNSGKTYNFVAASLMPSETASIVTALQHAFQ
ncbi:MAG: hypothetical protein M1404_07405 [Acidobacteria bacterium]|nr:hypothetical protein [Acidobacteriota bacterium]